jgi:hypothetical protein
VPHPEHQPHGRPCNHKNLPNALGKVNPGDTQMWENDPFATLRILGQLVIDEKHNHCVAFEGVKGDTVMLRDPQNGKRFTITRQEFLDSAASVHIAPGSESDFDWSRPQMGNLFTTDRGGD